MSMLLNGLVLKVFFIFGLFFKVWLEIIVNIVIFEFGINVVMVYCFLLILEVVGVLVSYCCGYFVLGGIIEELGCLVELVNLIVIKV